MKALGIISGSLQEGGIYKIQKKFFSDFLSISLVIIIINDQFNYYTNYIIIL